MNEDEEPSVQSTDGRAQRRFALAYEVLLFQFKLLADGVRDVLLSPLSIGAALLGLIVGGDEPAVYFRKLQRLGRRSDLWINLFGQFRHGPTADRFAEPLKERLSEEYQRGGWLSRGATKLNEALDEANRRAKSPPVDSSPGRFDRIDSRD